MSELYRPKTPWPWFAELTTDPALSEWCVYAGTPTTRETVATVPSYVDAHAISDLWEWIGRAERYERVLREIANQRDLFGGVVYRASAESVLREEGRL